MAQEYPLIPVYTLSDKQSKLSAAWMIEHCGWKGHSMGRAAVSSQHALVLINRGGASGKEILELARLIHKSVFDRFGIDLQTEPLIVGADV
jgi:UDP-N-acetylmuramate dehydrogenase